MATFQAQIAGLTKITISSSGTNPIESELSTFLTNGAKEIINIMPPELKRKAVTASILDDSPTTYDMDGGGEVLNVTRLSANSGGFYIPCREIPPMYGDLTNDSSSLYHATVTDPVYWVTSTAGGVSTLFVKPTTTANQPANVYHIAYPTVAYSEDTIANFPNEAEYLVVLYAAIKSIQSAMGGITLTSFSLSASSPDDVASAANISAGTVGTITIDALPSAPNYTAPKVAGATEELTAAITSGTIGTDDDFVDFSDWYEVLGHMIEDEEDIELAQAQLQKIQSYTQAYSNAMQNQLNIFNESNAVYQAAVQRNLQQAQINMQDAQKEADMTLQAQIQTYTLNLQRTSAAVARYQSLVQQEVQTYQQQIVEKTTEYQWLQSQQAKLQTDYDTGVTMLMTKVKPKAKEEAK